MSKLNQLSGLANNLADSFVSSTNLHFLTHMLSLPVEKTKLFEIDLLKETTKPEDLMSKTVKDIITQYKQWFISEIDKLKIGINNIDKVIIKIACNPRTTVTIYYTCNATITAKGKDYTKKIMTSYS